MCYIFKWVMTWPNNTKRPVPTINCWTQLAYSILIRLKQAFLQTTEIRTLFNWLRVIIRIWINIALLILLLYFVLKICFFTLKRNYQEMNHRHCYLWNYIEFKLKYEHTCLHTFIYLLMAHRFICIMCFIPKNSFIFNFSQTDAHVCFTEYGLSIYCVKCIVYDVT